MEVLHKLFKELIVGPLKFKMAEMHHLDNREMAMSYLNKKSSDFDEIWNTAAHLELDESQMIKYEKL